MERRAECIAKRWIGFFWLALLHLAVQLNGNSFASVVGVLQTSVKGEAELRLAPKRIPRALAGDLQASSPIKLRHQSPKKTKAGRSFQ